MIWTNRLLVVLTFLVAASVGLQVAVLYRLLPAYMSHAESPAQVTIAEPQPSPPAHSSALGKPVDLAGLQAEGKEDAKVAVIEFSDYECPFCASHVATVLQPLREEFVKTGKVRYLLANLPLPAHSNAKLLATSAICAGNQRSYWPMHDGLFRALPKTSDAVLDLARSLHLDLSVFSTCLNNPQSSGAIEHDVKEAETLGVVATPTFLIGKMEDSGRRALVTAVLVGAQPLNAFESAINETFSRKRGQ